MLYVNSYIFLFTIFIFFKVIYQENLQSPKQFEYRSFPEVIKLFFMFNSTGHGIYPANLLTG